jgi:hypothetical protein
MSGLNDLNQLLTTAPQGSWLYAQKGSWISEGGQYKLAIATGYWDKCWVCVRDILSLGTTAQKTQELVNSLLKPSIQTIQTPHLIVGPLAYLQPIKDYKSVISNLSNVQLIWGKALTPPSEFELLCSFHSFGQEIERIQEFVSILPVNDQPTVKEPYNRVQERLDKWNSLFSNEPRPSSEAQLQSWIDVVEAIKEFKVAFFSNFQPLGDAALENMSLHQVAWIYKLGIWTLIPQQKIFETTKGSHFTLPYLHIDLDLQAIADEWWDYFLTLSKKELSQLKKWESGKITELTQPLLNFMQHQLEGQKRPIFISCFTSNISPMITSLDKFLEFIKLLATELSNSGLFIHNQSVFEKISREGLSNFEDSYLCFSRFVYLNSGKDHTKKEKILYSSYLGKRPIELMKAQKETLRLMQNQSTFDFTVQLSGKQQTCSKAVLLEAFPFLQAQEAMKGKMKDFDPNLLNLDTLQKDISIPNGFEEWILTSLVTFAYTREHPLLPLNSSDDAQQALAVYYGLVDYLRPNSAPQI